MTIEVSYGRSFTCSTCGNAFPAASSGPLPKRCDSCIVAGGGRPKRRTQDVGTVQNSPERAGTVQTRTQTHRKGPRSSSASSVQAQERVTRALSMRRDGHTWEQIAAECGYASRGAAFTAAKHEMSLRQDQINETIDQLRATELERLEHYSAEALAVLQREQPVFDTNGAPRVGPDGEPLSQRIDATSLQAIDRLVKVSESRRKLLGLDAATKSEVSSQVAFTVQGIAEGDMP